MLPRRVPTEGCCCRAGESAPTPVRDRPGWARRTMFTTVDCSAGNGRWSRSAIARSAVLRGQQGVELLGSGCVPQGHAGLRLSGSSTRARSAGWRSDRSVHFERYRPSNMPVFSFCTASPIQGRPPAALIRPDDQAPSWEPFPPRAGTAAASGRQRDAPALVGHEPHHRFDSRSCRSSGPRQQTR